MTQQFVMTVYHMADNSKLSTQALIEKAIEHWHNKEMN
jgi:predicted DNA-binding ribbon-helix-helix protein